MLFFNVLVLRRTAKRDVKLTTLFALFQATTVTTYHIPYIPVVLAHLHKFRVPRRVDSWPFSVQDSCLVVVVSREGGFPPEHGPKNVAHTVNVQLLRERLPGGGTNAGIVLSKIHLRLSQAKAV